MKAIGIDYGSNDGSYTIEVCIMDAPMFCEKCTWAGKMQESYHQGIGCVCPQCGNPWSVTAGVRPRTVREEK